MNVYAYVKDTNRFVDVFGLNALPETAEQWEKRFAKMPVSEKYNAARGKLEKIAKKNNWTKNQTLTKINNRIVYEDKNKKLYAFDTQHGRFEYLDSRGNHLGEFDIDGNQTKVADTSGKHNIVCP